MERPREIKIYSYVVDHDEGREPNPYFGMCTLCRCKFSKTAEATRGLKGRKNIVESAIVGDWVLGTGGASQRSAGNGRLIYAMRVDDKLPREKYYKDPRFKNRRPEAPMDDFQKHCQFALVSRHFYYFGANAKPIPKRFKHFEKKGPGFRYIDPMDFRPFVEWLEKNYKPGKQGEPCAQVAREPKESRQCKSSC